MSIASEKASKQPEMTGTLPEGDFRNCLRCPTTTIPPHHYRFSRNTSCYDVNSDGDRDDAGDNGDAGNDHDNNDDDYQYHNHYDPSHPISVFSGPPRHHCYFARGRPEDAPKHALTRTAELEHDKLSRGNCRKVTEKLTARTNSNDIVSGRKDEQQNTNSYNKMTAIQGQQSAVRQYCTCWLDATLLLTSRCTASINMECGVVQLMPMHRWT
uniref:Uncharacterized protein n=1 Tax=Setaria digitata TaxID=48799 RepID=A0A915PAZ3_9BILA